MKEQKEQPITNIDEIPSREISDPAVLSKTPLVTARMITYNHESFIAQAIEGVLMQETDFPIELVIGEDCSTDRTSKIVLEYQKKYHDIIRVITSDQNVGAIRNGLRTNKACRGKYIAHCEGDDYWIDKQKLQKQAEFLEANPDFVICCTNAIRKYENNDEPERVIFGDIPKDEFTLDDTVKKRICLTLTLMYRRETFLNPPEWYYRLPYGDRAMITLIMERGKMKYLPDVTSVYRKHGGGFCSSRGETGEFDKMGIVVTKALKRYFYPKYSRIFNRNMSSRSRIVAGKRQLYGDNVEARQYIAKAFKYSPLFSLSDSRFYKEALSVFVPKLYRTLKTMKEKVLSGVK